jgi:hypothetical protein
LTWRRCRGGNKRKERNQYKGDWKEVKKDAPTPYGTDPGIDYWVDEELESDANGA